MCLIIASTGEHKPSEDVLRDAEKRNGDGAGFAWVSNNQIQWRKGLDVEDIIKCVKKASTPFVVHFRIGTHGPKIPELTHPFPVTSKAIPYLNGRSPRVLFQNGTYSDWEKDLKSALLGAGLKCPPPPWSDARALAVITHIMGKEYLKLCGTSRFLIFDGTKKKGTMDLIGDWHKADDGCYYSNKGSSAFPETTNYKSYQTGSNSGGNQSNFRQASGTQTGGDTGKKTQSSATGGEGGNFARAATLKQHASIRAVSPEALWTGFDSLGHQSSKER